MMIGKSIRTWFFQARIHHSLIIMKIAFYCMHYIQLTSCVVYRIVILMCFLFIGPNVQCVEELFIFADH